MADRKILLVVGPGRSGTSAVTGTLAHGGYRVPDSIKPKESNPRGHYEPRWLVRFHRARLQAAGLRASESDPTAPQVLSASLDRDLAKAQIRAWVEQELGYGAPLALKDPRLVWFGDLWIELAEELGVDLGFLVMVRHPSEVVASRATYYDSDAARAVAGWINIALTVERLTRGSRRALVHYPDLIGDWRSTFRAVDERIGLALTPPIDVNPHPIDDFIDPGLRRMAKGWGERTVPAWMSDLADRVFAELLAIAEGREDTSHATLDALGEEYAATFEAGYAMTAGRRRRDFASGKTTPPPGFPVTSAPAEPSRTTRDLRRLFGR